MGYLVEREILDFVRYGGDFYGNFEEMVFWSWEKYNYLDDIYRIIRIVELLVVGNRNKVIGIGICLYMFIYKKFKRYFFVNLDIGEKVWNYRFFFVKVLRLIWFFFVYFRVYFRLMCL